MAASLYTQAVTTIHAALYGNQPAHPVFVTETNAASMGVAAYANSKVVSVADGGWSDAALATTVLTNMGINNPDLNDALTAYFAAAPADRGYVIVQLGQILTALADPAHPQFANYGAAAESWNSSQAAAYIYSSNPLNVVAAPSAELPEVPVTSGTVFTASSDSIQGSSLNELFNAPLSQNEFAGGVSNTLSSADKLNGGGGTDTLAAELVPEFFGATGNNQIDVQPKIAAVEVLTFEARDAGANLIGTQGEVITVDAKYITGHNSIGSKFSDGDLIIENLTTLTDAGVARNTEAITITMDHTDNFNSDNDASDLTVYFDEDYLLAGQTAASQAFYFLLDEAAELAGNPNRLERIDVDGIRFTLAGSTTVHELQSPAAQTAGTHAGFVAALQADLAAMIASGTLPVGTTLTVSTIRTDTTGLDDGSISAPIPAILLTIGDGTKVTPIGFSRVEELIGAYDVYGQFDDVSSVAALPVTVNIDLNKAGREGEGGDLIIGGKELDSDGGRQDEGKGITVFKVNVMGDSSKPSNLGTLDSTNGDLETIIIKTDAAYASGTTFASLTVRDGFGNAGVVIPGQVNQDNDLKLVDANAFKGDLTLGEDIRVLNLDTLNATGGGKIEFYANLDGAEEDQAYSYTTGAAADKVDVLISGDAVDFANSSVNVLTGAGKDVVNITTAMVDAQSNQILNQVILKNIAVNTGADDDTVTLMASTQGDIEISTEAGNDVIYTSAGVGRAIWAFNYDDARTDVTSLASTPGDNLPGVQTSLAFLGGATVRVTLSGAGLAAAAGGGVMAVTDIDADGNLLADAFADGYEASTTITSLINKNQHFGDQRDINAAIIKIITGDATLSKLLTATISTNNTLLVASKTGGAFNSDDLEITLVQLTARTTSVPSYAAAVLAEAETVFHNSLLTTADLWGSATPGETSGYVGAAKGAGAIDTVNGQLGLTTYYTGLGVDNATLHTAAAASLLETDNIINAGAGNDVIVLSTDAVDGGVPAYSSPAVGLTTDLDVHNRLLNGASNETITMTDAVFGNDVVMNFTANAALPGVDFLDFTAYLTSKHSPSGSTASTVVLPVTMDNTVVTDAATATDANDVVVVRFDNTDEATETFANLSASVIAALYNNTTSVIADGQYGNFVDAGFVANAGYVNTATDINLLNGAAKAVVMVENNDNLGYYKVFELSWNGLASAASHAVTAVEIGSLDFGTTLVGMTEVVLIDSVANDALSLGGGVVVPPTFAVAATAASVNEGSTATFTVTTTNVADGTVLAYTLGGTVSPADITGGLTGTVTITNGTGTIAAALVADQTTEGAETLTVTVGTATSTVVTVNDTSLTPPASTPLLIGSTAPVTATAGVDVYSFDVAAALASGPDTQIAINGFAVAQDSLIFDLPTAAGNTTLAALNGTQGVAVQVDGINGQTVINFGNDATGDVVVLTLVGVTDASLVNVSVI